MSDGFLSLPYFHKSIWTFIFGWKPSPILLLPAFSIRNIILALCVPCTLSIEAAKPSRQKNKDNLLLLVVIRTLLAIPAVIIYIDAILAPHISESRHFSSAVATIGSYGIFKTWEICFAPLFDNASLPNWVPSYNPKPNGIGNGKEIHREKVTTLSKENHRILYSLDFLTTLRGVSWLSDRRFDFLAPVYIQEQRRTPHRSKFIRDRLLHLLLVNMAYDILDTMNKSPRWVKMTDLVTNHNEVAILSPLDAIYAHQVTTRPLYQQAAFISLTAADTQLSLEVFYTILALICIGLFNVSPLAFPHFYNNPFSLRTNSVRSFWGERWHHIFRRVFDRAIDPGMHVVGINKRTIFGKTYRVLAIFLMSGLLHCLIQARVQMYLFPPGYAPPLFDSDTLYFFLSQPFALAFEQTVLQPVLSRTPAWISWWICRIWTWGWLFWTGRWYTDCWVKMGMWQPEEKVVLFSPIRVCGKGNGSLNSNVHSCRDSRILV